MQNKLQEMARKDMKILDGYIPEWAYGGSYGCTDINKMNPDDLSFDDAHTVKSIMFTANEEYVDIEIG
jgi:hypothetical protein